MSASDSIDTAWSLIQDELGPVASSESIALIYPATCPEVLKLLRTLPRSSVRILHSFRPATSRFEALGLECSQELAAQSFDKILFIPTRQRTESLGLVARGLLALKPEGEFLFACPNSNGAKGYISHLKEVFPELEAESAKKCRYFKLRPSEVQNPELLDSWVRESGPSQILDTEFHSVAGIYGWNKVDPGSALLVSTLPKLEGRGADFGSGYGYLSKQILEDSPAITQLAIVEAELRALDCAKLNLSKFSNCEYLWADVTNPNSLKNLRDLDWIVMNPPFHESSDPDPEIGQNFIRAARACLGPRGKLYLVANAFLPYEKILSTEFKSWERVCEKEGFKVIHAHC